MFLFNFKGFKKILYKCTLGYTQTDDDKGKKIILKGEDGGKFDFNNIDIINNFYRDKNLKTIYTLVFCGESLEFNKEGLVGSNVILALFDKKDSANLQDESFDCTKYTNICSLIDPEDSWFLNIFYKLENGKRNKKNDKDIIYRNCGIPAQVQNLNFLKAIQKKDVISFDGKLSEKNGVLTFTVEKTNIGQKEMRNRQLSNKKFDINLMLLNENQLNNLNNFIDCCNGYNTDLSDNAFVFFACLNDFEFNNFKNFAEKVENGFDSQQIFQTDFFYLFIESLSHDQAYKLEDLINEGSNKQKNNQAYKAEAIAQKQYNQFENLDGFNLDCDKAYIFNNDEIIEQKDNQAYNNDEIIERPLKSKIILIVALTASITIPGVFILIKIKSSKKQK